MRKFSNVPLLAFVVLWHTWAGAREATLFNCHTKLAQKLRVAIVSGISSGSAIPARFKRLGLIESVHVMPKGGLPEGYALTESDYVANVPYTDDLKAMAQQLKLLGVTVVLPGSENGVDLADALSEEMGLITNGTRLTRARRDKYLMQEVVKAYLSARYPKGIPGIRQTKVATLEDFKEWHVDHNDSQWPVVIKPLESAATDGLHICESYEQVEKALAATIGKPGFLGNMNHQMLAQEYLKKGVRWEGDKHVVIPADEYVVDMVSLRKNRVVTDVWKYHKTLTERPDGGLSNIYDYDELLDFDDEIVKELIAYAREVLDALGIDNGPSHMEIMMTDRGPVLVEVGARLIGGNSHLAVEEATGVNPITVMYEAYFDELAFAKRLLNPIRRKKHTWMVQFISPRGGKIRKIPGLAKLLQIPGLVSYDLHAHIGEEMPQTVDLLTSPGQAIFSADTREGVERARNRVREIEPRFYSYENWWSRFLTRFTVRYWRNYLSR